METYQFKLKEYPRVVNYFINSLCLNLKLINYRIEYGFPDCDSKQDLIFLNESTNEFIHFQLGKVSNFLEINEKVERIFKSQVYENSFTVFFKNHVLDIHQI